MRTNDYLVGQEFPAADLTFCALINPLTNVPFFIDNPRFKVAFEYHERIREKCHPKYRRRVKINENRPVNRVKRFIQQYNSVAHFFFSVMAITVSKIYEPTNDEREQPQFKVSSLSNNGQHKKEAVNDQRVIRTKFSWATLPFIFKYLCHFLFTIPVQATDLNGEP